MLPLLSQSINSQYINIIQFFSYPAIFRYVAIVYYHLNKSSFNLFIQIINLTIENKMFMLIY